MEALEVKIDSPKAGANLALGDPLRLAGRCGDKIKQVELFAEHHHLGAVTVSSGGWEFEHQGFTVGGTRHLQAVAMDSAGQPQGIDRIDVTLSRTIELGIDVSDHNGTVNWKKVRAAGFTFAFTKATEGTTFKASSFATNWKQMEAAGVVRGAYHFFRPSRDAADQANHFLQTVGQLRRGDLPPVVDLEHFPKHVELEWAGLSLANRVKAVRKYIDTVEAALKRKVLIYTSFGFWSSFMPGKKDFSGQPLWVANYTTKAKPFLPKEWSDWNFWQFTDSGTADGVPSGGEDINRFNGSFQKLTAFIEDTHL